MKYCISRIVDGMYVELLARQFWAVSHMVPRSPTNQMSVVSSGGGTGPCSRSGSPRILPETSILGFDRIWHIVKK